MQGNDKQMVAAPVTPASSSSSIILPAESSSAGIEFYAQQTGGCCDTVSYSFGKEESDASHKENGGMILRSAPVPKSEVSKRRKSDPRKGDEPLIRNGENALPGGPDGSTVHSAREKKAFVEKTLEEFGSEFETPKPVKSEHAQYGGK